MIFSSDRKRALSGWLLCYDDALFHKSLKLQKFLFFYEMISKSKGEMAEFKSLTGYENGPVFGDVYGEYTYEWQDFLEDSKKTFNNLKETIDYNIAKTSAFLVKILTETELSELTHSFNVWNCKESQIYAGIKNVRLSEQDISDEDLEKIRILSTMYSDELIESSEIIEFNGKSFILPKDEMKFLKEDTYDILMKLSEIDDLVNPIYINLTEEGTVLVD